MGERWVLVLASFALRLLVPLAQGPERFHERGYGQYVEMADDLLAGEGLHRTLPYGHGDRRAWRTPLYPLLLAGLRWLGGPFHLEVVLLGAACGAATVGLVHALAGWWFGGAAARVAGAIAAAWPHAVVHDAALQDTALYTALLVGTVLAVVVASGATPGRAAPLAAVVGLLGGLTVLTRAMLLPTVLALLAWVAASRWSAGRGRALLLAGVATLVLGACLAPWLVRNDRVVGAPVVTSDVGRSLWLGNNPQLFEVYPRRSIDRAEERAWAAMAPAERAAARALAARELDSDAWFRARALSWMRQHPAKALAGALRKAWATFSPWWNPEGSLGKQLAHLLSYGPVALLALVTAWRQRARWAELLPIALVAALLAAQSAVFFGHSSYRAYLDPLLVVLAAPAVVALAQRLRPAARAS
jgi:hypothetical protein